MYYKAGRLVVTKYYVCLIRMNDSRREDFCVEQTVVTTKKKRRVFGRVIPSDGLNYLESDTIIIIDRNECF